MKLIKLNAIPSTNDYLKEISKRNQLENFTTVYTSFQTQGKGQRGNSWLIEPDKNLTFSTLYQFPNINSLSIFDLNIITAISIVEALEQLDISNLQIKWPNDIMLRNKKIGGILIENNFSSNNTINSVIGIGINVNQEKFTDLPSASSLLNLCNTTFDVEQILHLILNRLEQNLSNISDDVINIFWTTYHKYLFRKGVPSVFETPDQKMQMGIIQRVLRNGKIEILFENDLTQQFDLKEIKLIY
ncbi:MAG: biotin--[acetyl-CoA-carboxylase] ligase [Bacteroidota bacterium]|nr:biotin--[acetyl-CoA-carboxylase] ligase [Bacteroidota bacterium]